MHYLLGTDEAGYGPNLGPLVIAASLWQVEEANGEEDDLYARLASGVTSTANCKQGRIAVADSKQLYSSGDSLALLERGVLSALQLLGRNVDSCAALLPTVASEWSTSLVWQRDFNCQLPSALNADSLQQAVEHWRSSCALGKVSLLDYRAKLIQPAEFNAGCARLGSKGAVLSSATLSLVRELIRNRHDSPLRIVCDKHGGRNSYAGLVYNEVAQFECGENPFSLQTLREGRAESAYRWNCGEQTREIRFVAKGERFLPAALASMLAKYLRELSMRAWNEFWCQQVPNLKPTAGYPLDAKRYRTAIEETAHKLELAVNTWWREK